MQRAKTGALAAGVAVVCCLTGCGQDRATARPPTVSTSAVTPSPTTSAPTTPLTSTSSVPTKPVGADPALSAALNKLAADSRALKSQTALTAVRSSVAGGMTAARQGLQATRSAAYPDTTRDCGRAASSVGATRAGAETTNRASATLVGAAAARQKQLGSLSSSIASVRTLAARQPAGAVPSRADIEAAVKAASAQLTVETASLRDVRATTADGVVRTRDMLATAYAIYAKVC